MVDEAIDMGTRLGGSVVKAWPSSTSPGRRRSAHRSPTPKASRWPSSAPGVSVQLSPVVRLTTFHRRRWDMLRLRRICVPQRMPLRCAGDRRVVELVHDAVTAPGEVEVQAPVRVMVVEIAHARAADCGEPEPRPDRAVGGQSPRAHVAVPAGLELAHEHGLVTVDEDRDAEMVPMVVRARTRGIVCAGVVHNRKPGAGSAPSALSIDSSFCQSR